VDVDALIRRRQNEPGRPRKMVDVRECFWEAAGATSRWFYFSVSCCNSVRYGC